MKGHVIICGLGHIGFPSFELFQQLGIKVAVITDKTSDDWRKRVENSGGLFFLGDARSDDLLEKAGIKDASAVLAVTDKDLVNVSVAMDARRLNANVKIVCRLFDTNLGKHISDAFNISQIFSASEIAAPVFVGAILQSTTMAHGSLQGQRFTLAEAAQEGGYSVAVIGSDGEIGHKNTSPQGAKHQLFLQAVRLAPRAGVTAMDAMVNWLRLPSLAKFRRIVSLIFVVILISALVVKTQMSLSWIDAFYFVTTTITTVGYGDFNFSSASPAMKVFGILLMLIGATSLAILFSTVAESIISERFSGLFGGRTVPRKDHVIVVGAGHIGLRVAEQLASSHVPVVVIENDIAGRFSADVKRRVAVIEGDARNADTLRQANLETAKAILVVSDDDVENLSVGLSAQSLNPTITTVVRVFDADLGEKLQAKLSVSRILSVSGIAAPYFVAATLVDNITTSIRWHNHLVFLSKGGGKGTDLGLIQMPNSNGTLHLSAMRLLEACSG